jgi:hypothetical protein
VIDVAFRAHENAHWTPVARQDVLRVIDDRVIVVANAYADGFSSFWPIGSRTVLELFDERWKATRDLEASFAHVRLQFPERAATLPHPFEDEDLGPPAASLLAAVIEPDVIDVAWIGTQHLVVVRDGAVTSRTQPDTLVEMGRAQGFDMTDSPHRDVITRTIRREDILPPHTARFARKKGDRVIVASEALDAAIAETARAVLEKLPRDKFECAIVIE